MISFLLLLKNLSNDAIEIGISAVLERIDAVDGSVYYKENIGDYPAT